jgi:non-specific serine/threonine protein kinase
MNSPRVAGAAAVVGDMLVVVGGQADDRLVPSTEVFDGKEWREVADIPTPREHLAAVSDGRYVYAVGGRNLNAAENSKSLERYDPAQDRWEVLPDMPQALGGLGAAFVEGNVVAVGGETSTGVLDATLVYDVAGGKWTSADPLRTPRHGMSVVGFGDTVYALDGALAAGHTGSTRIAEALAFKRRGKG